MYRNYISFLAGSLTLRGPLASNPTARMLHTIVLSLALWYAFWSIVLLPLYPGAAAKLPAVLLQEAGPVASLILLRLGHLRPASLAYLIGTWAFTTLVIVQDGGIRSPVQLFYATLPVLATWLLGYSGALWTAGICLLSALVFAFLDAAGLVLPRTIHTTPFGLWAIQLQVIVIGAVPVAQILRELQERSAELKSLLEEKSFLLSEVQEREERFHTLADHMAQLAWMADGAGRVFWCNGRWVRFTGVPLDGLHAWEWDHLIHPDYSAGARVRLRESLSSGQPWEDVFPIRREDGTFRWFLSRADAIHDRHGNIIRWFGTSTDITDQKKIETALRRSNEDLQQFTYIASHDMREPLRNVSNYAEFLARSYKDERFAAQRDKSIDVIVAGAARMEAMITAILQYARIAGDGELSRASVDMNEVFGETLSNLQTSLQSVGALIKANDLPTLFANRSQMVQLLQNLIANAVKYRHPDRQLRIVVSAESGVDHWLFTVTDNGEGFRQEYADKIFGIFKRLHGSAVEGTGIGLAVCRAVVEGHGGKIWAVGTLGEGAQFCFTMPRHS